MKLSKKLTIAIGTVLAVLIGDLPATELILSWDWTITWTDYAIKVWMALRYVLVGIVIAVCGLDKKGIPDGSDSNSLLPEKEGIIEPDVEETADASELIKTVDAAGNKFINNK